MDDLQHIVVKRDGDVTTVTLDRPEKRNALALDVMTELTAASRRSATSDARGIVLAANGPVFSAGHNFGDMAGATYDDARHVFDVCTRMMTAFQAVPAGRHRPGPRAGHRGRLPARGVVRSGGGRRLGRLRHPRRQGRAVLPHPAGGRRPQHRAQAGPRDGLHRRRHRRRDGRRLGADQPGRARRRAGRRGRRPAGAGDRAARRRPRRSASGRSTPRSTWTRPGPTSTPAT